MPYRPTLLAVVVSLGWAGCDNRPSIELPDTRDESPSTAGDGDDVHTAMCDQAPDGTPCGLERHCLFNACVENACGDGIVAGTEACDDGNERDHDGCDGRCRFEPTPGCGNGVLEPGEECDDGAPAESSSCTAVCTKVRCGDAIVSGGEDCDDGNLRDDDACTSQCRDPLERCGDGKVDVGERCDDGNTESGDGCEANCKPSPPPDLDASVADGGPFARDAGSTADAQTPPEAPEDAGLNVPSEDAGASVYPHGLAQEQPGCAACRDEVCTAYQGVFDLVAKCFHEADPVFVQQCVDVLDCAYQHKCGYGATGAPACFCGSADLNTCQTAGKADGPCQDEFYAAAHTTQLAELIGRFGDVSLPVGVAYYFIECDRDFCAACVP